MPWWHFTRRAPSSPTTRASPGASAASASPSGDPSCVEAAADHRRGRPVEQPLGRGVQAADALVEVEDHDAGRRDVQHLAEELVLLREPHALVAQVVDHPVVDADQLVDLGLADLAGTAT